MKWKILFISIIVSVCVFSQESKTLSANGQRHYKAAMTLFDMASNAEDYKTVAGEFEQVIATDPNYADTYFNLGKIYTKLGKEFGEPYFKKAKEAFVKYKSLRPEESSVIDDELYAVELVDKSSVKYRTEKNLESLIGTWKGTFYYTLQISQKSDNLQVELLVNGRKSIATNVKFDGINLTFQAIDNDDDYGEDGWDSCDKWSGRCNFSSDRMQWKCTLNNNSMSIYCDHHCIFYLKGRQVGECKGIIKDTYTKK